MGGGGGGSDYGGDGNGYSDGSDVAANGRAVRNAAPAAQALDGGNILQSFAPPLSAAGTGTANDTTVGGVVGGDGNGVGGSGDGVDGDSNGVGSSGSDDGVDVAADCRTIRKTVPAAQALYKHPPEIKKAPPLLSAAGTVIANAAAVGGAAGGDGDGVDVAANCRYRP